MTTLRTVAPYVITFVLFAAWYSLVLMHQAPAADFLTALTGALSGLGVHTIHLSQKGAGNAQS